MAIQEGNNPGEYPPTVPYIQPGDAVDQAHLRPPSVTIEDRTDVIRTFVETLEVSTLAHINATSNVHGVSGALITTNTAQEIQNKEFTAVAALELKKATYADLVTFATNNGGNSLCYGTDTEKAYGIVNNALVELGTSSGVTAPQVPIITQTSHGFAVLSIVYQDATSGIWGLAQNDVETTTTQYVVASVISADEFTIARKGTVVHTSHGLTVGAIYFASVSTAGAKTTIRPTSGFIQPVMVPIDSDRVVLNVTAYQSAVAAAYTLDSLSDVDTAAVADGDVLIADNAAVFRAGDGYDTTAWVAHTSNDSIHMQGATLTDAISEVNAVELPIGSILVYVCGTQPTHFLEADGTTFDQVAYPDLYTALSNSNVLPMVTEYSNVGTSSYIKAKSITDL